MDNSGEHLSAARKAAEASSIALLPAAGAVDLLHSSDAYHYLSVPWAEQIPGADHASNMLGGMVVGMAMTAAAEGVAARLEARGHETAAERVSRVGKVVAWAGSVVTQVIAETSRHGRGDKWDVVAGIAATAPGIIAGQVMGRAFRRPTRQ